MANEEIIPGDTAEARREQIMAGALEVFSSKGFVRATNKDVAAAAGIRSPGLIYHYFEDKAALLRAVVDRYAPPFRLVLHPEELNALPLEEGLARFAQVYLDMLSDAKSGATLRVLFGEALREPAVARLIGSIGPQRIWMVMTQYLARQMDAGVLRRTDPAQAALCFVGPLVAYLLLHRVFEVEPIQALDGEALVQTHIELFVRGLKVDTKVE